MEDASKVAASILKGIGPKEESDNPDSPPDIDDSSAGLEAAGEDVMAAFHSKDVSALVDSLKAFMQLAQE
jgi:hypothetical protein